MRIAFISSLNGGVGTYTIGLINELSTSIDTIDLYLFSSNKGNNSLNFANNVNINVYTNSPFKLIISLFKNLKQLSKSSIIHLNYVSFFFPIYLIKILWGTPYVITSHGIPQPNLEKGLMKIYYSIEKGLLKIASKYANRNIAISNYVQKYLLNEYGIESSVIYHGIESNTLPKLGNEKREDIRKKLNLPANQIMALFVGTMNKYKNIMILIDAIPPVLAIKEDIFFVFIGKGELLDDVKEAEKNFNINNKVFIIPYAEDLMPYYTVADLFILPSINEMFGLVLLEAMNYGLPIIASNGGACPEVLGDAGILFNPNNSEELSKKIIELIDNEELYNIQINRSLERVKQFTWHKAAEEYKLLYCSCIKDANDLTVE